MSIAGFQNPDEARRRGVRMAAARALRGLSQLAAAKQIGVSRTTLSGWENGEPIDEAWIEPIVRVYGGSKGWIRYGEGVAPRGYNSEPLEADPRVLAFGPEMPQESPKDREVGRVDLEPVDRPSAAKRRHRGQA